MEQIEKNNSRINALLAEKLELKRKMQHQDEKMSALNDVIKRYDEKKKLVYIELNKIREIIEKFSMKEFKIDLEIESLKAEAEKLY